MNHLYDRSRHFFDNLERGQRRLTEREAAAEKRLKDEMKQIAKVREGAKLDFKIFGVGGISAPTDVSEMLALGADAVESGGGAMTIPLLGLEVKKHLLEQAMK